MAYKKLYQGSLPTSEVTSSPGIFQADYHSNAVEINELVFSNTSGSTGQVYLSIVSPASTGGATNRLISGLTLNSDATDGPTQITCRWAVDQGSFVTAYSSISGIILTIFGETK